MRTGTIAFLGGIVIFLQISTLPSLWILLFPPITLLVALPLIKDRTPYLYCWRVICAVVCGFLWAFLRADAILSHELDKRIEGKTVIVTGKVTSLPEILDSGIRLEFKINEMRSENGEILSSPGEVRLGWYREAVTIKPGEYWRLHVRLKRPYGFSNPGGFDYERWLFQHRIRGTGYIINDKKNELLRNASIISINHSRYLLRNFINQTDLGEFEKSFMLALSLGDRSKISAKHWQTLTQTGTSHLLAISGLHIGLVAGLFFILGRWLWAFSPSLPLYLASQRFAALSALSGALIYAALAGFSIPTQRALIMLSIWLLSRFFHRRFVSSDVIALSLLAVLIIDPLAVVDVGFWLSFLAVSTIAYGMTCRVHTSSSIWRNSWWKWGRVQYLVAVGLLPVLVLWFQQYPLMGIFANIIAVPYVGFIVVPLVLMGAILLQIYFPAGELILQLAGQALGLFWPFLDYLSTLKFSLWQSVSPSSLTFASAMFGVLILLMPKGMPDRWLGVFFLLPLLYPRPDSPGSGAFWLTQLDVGQGLASVIQTQNHSLIYDTGDRFSERFNTGEAVIIPFFKHQRLRHPDLLILSHGDRDHIGGSEAVLTSYPKLNVLTSAVNKIRHFSVERCVAGQQWHWDGVDFEILHPAPTGNYKGNNSSCVLKVSNGRHSILLTGDIEQAAESRLVNAIPNKLSSTVLIAPHHGSKTSSSPAFIDAVSPETVVFSAGYRNRFGFPKQDIISRYESRQVKILNTARDGALLFKFEQSGMTVNKHRQWNRRFWTTEY